MRRASFARGWRLATLVAVITAIGCAGGEKPSIVAASSEAPSGLIDLDGNQSDLWQAGGAGRVTVAIFTRADCPISNRYAPDVRALYEKFHPRDVDFVLIYVDPREKPEAIREHLREYAYRCPALRDPTHALVSLTGATVTPEAVVFDTHRKVAYRGRINDRYNDLGDSRPDATTDDLADALEATLAGRPVAEPVTKAVGCYIDDLK